MSDEERKLLNKARLWLILHGYLFEYLHSDFWPDCEICKCSHIYSDCSSARIEVNKELTKIVKEDEITYRARCITWVKYV